MKLLTKTSISYLWVSFVVLLVMGILLFFVLKTAVSAEIREQLELELAKVVAETERGGKINSPLIRITAGTEAELNSPPIFSDTLIYDNLQNEEEGYYYLKQSKLVNHQPLTILVMDSYIGWDGYTKAILIIFVFMASMLVIAGALVNYRISKKVWSPFLSNLDLLKSYSVSSKQHLELKSSNIDEFEALNAVATGLINKARNEYQVLKEFTENASHEIQTPLSILKSRLESISQLAMDDELARFITDAKLAADRLSRVNRSLLLLAKLENDHFEDQQMMRLDSALIKNLTLMEDLFEQRDITISQHTELVSLVASPYLIDILIINLLSNLRSHAIPGSEGAVVLNQRGMSFSNEGAPLKFRKEQLFTRFGKGFNGYQGTGLGLSIVKQICILHNWTISYHYTNKLHTFQIDFSNQ